MDSWTVLLRASFPKRPLRQRQMFHVSPQEQKCRNVFSLTLLIGECGWWDVWGNCTYLNWNLVRVCCNWNGYWSTCVKSTFTKITCYKNAWQNQKSAFSFDCRVLKSKTSCNYIVLCINVVPGANLFLQYFCFQGKNVGIWEVETKTTLKWL